MTHIEQKEQDYAKWQTSIWNSVEKEISLFQKKVTDCMMQLGDFAKKKREDFQVEPCLDEDVILGEDFYIELIRPVCVSKGYLPKKPPTDQDVQDISFAEQDDRREKNINKLSETKNNIKDGGKGSTSHKGQKQGGKGKAGKGVNNEQAMKVKIVKENFQKDIELVMKSHSMERMQVEFGLKHRKLEVKLMTFFYVAFYIRKNKVNQKIPDSEVFELINILIKIVRIFSLFRGKSFVDNSRQVEVSTTLILDLKFCIKGLKEFYKYDNKVVMIKYPKLVYYTNYDKFFPTLDIKPYESQISFIQAVKQALNDRGNIAHPTLILYKTMIGSGKTSASIALSQLVNQCKLIDQKNSKMQVLYSCLIGSVRIQVGRYAYNKKQKFALAAMERSIKDPEYFYPRIINSWSCRNESIVDLVISDLYCSHEMLDQPYEEQQPETMAHERKNRKQVVNVGRLDRENLVLFIDEPTAFCKSADSKATRKLFDILANYPPKLTILASATMPAASQLTNTIELIGRKNPKLQVFEVESQEFQIGCQYCSFKGEIVFPHTGVKSRQELNTIIQLLKKNPFLMRLYTGPSLFHLLRKCEEYGLKNLPNVNDFPQIRQKDIISATFKILFNLSKQQDELIEEVCKLSKSHDNIDFKEDIKAADSDNSDFDFMEQDEEDKDDQEAKDNAEREDYVDFQKLIKGDAYKFLGGCMIGTADPIGFAKATFAKWIRHIKPIKRLLEKYQKEFEQLEKEIRLLQDDKEMREEKKTQKITKLQTEKEPVLDFPEKKKINTADHYARYCKAKEPTHQSMLIKPVPLENVGKQLIEEADDFMLKLLFCGVAVYAQKGLSPKYLDKVEELASQNFLAYIISDESLCYGANFPISNVILRDDLAIKLNMNEMFQLIGRAGRVGQSWTARAFLEPKGLEKLNNYIHKPQCQISDEGKIFEEIAEEHLNYPLLRLRTNISEIRYLDNIENSEFVEILIKKKVMAESHLFKRVVLVPYLQQTGGRVRILSEKMPYVKTNHYRQPSSGLSYEDLPKIQNRKGIQVIDVKAYYENQQEYINKVISNAIKRILSETLGGVLSEATQKNEFKAKVYEEYFSSETNTFTVLFECKKEVSHAKYQFHELLPDSNQGGDDLADESLRALFEQVVKLLPGIREHPSGVTQVEIKRAITLHQELMKRSKFEFYKQPFAYVLPQAEKEFQKSIESIKDKEIIQCRKECAVVIAISKIADVLNHSHRFSHVDKNVRSIWPKVMERTEK